MNTERFDMTTVRVYYGNRDISSEIQPSATIIRGPSSSGTPIKPLNSGVENGIRYIEAELECGLYCYKVYYTTDRDYGIKYFYVDGKEEYLEYTLLMEPYSVGSHMQRAFSNTTDHVLNEFYNTDKIDGFKEYATPAFLNHRYDRVFTTNAELCDFCENIAKGNKYAHLYYPIGLTEQYGLKTPLLVFTKDVVPEGATLAEISQIIADKGVREIMMISGGMHGNEPAGTEGVLAYAAELSSEYGKEVLDKFGAVILIPCVSADNSCTFTRCYPDGCNSNRDLLVCEHDGSLAYSFAYNLFMPTVTVSCHEDVGVLKVNNADYSIEDIHNVALAFNGAANTPVMDVNAAIKGENVYAEHKGMEILQNAIDKLNSVGYRAQHYRYPSYFPASERSYAAVRGAFAYLIELSGIDNGKGNFPLRVHGEVSTIKAIADEVMSTNGGVAQTVRDAREKVRVKEYDPENGFVLKMSKDEIGEDAHPSIYADGTFKDESAVRTRQLYCKAESSRPMPTAYVIPADLTYIESILKLLETHNIAYKKLDCGSSLQLRRYSMTYPPQAMVELGEKETVSFEKGAYLVSTDSPAAYLIAYLFEPDSYPAGEGYRVSLFNMGYIRASDALYRSEENNITDMIR